MSKWISVEDELPTVNEEYIVYGINKGATIVTCIEWIDGEFGTEEHGNVWDELVTHWMPLPEPPKDK